ncbi:dihydrofolate reductase family protein [Silvibacterium sp.]|uniref:dihydrofolate reductase family protein n=1 Tax=Silvibacterium sp. TaxID=1964179 RepID=UPI0039E447A8
MGKVRVAAFAVSLDGFGAGPGQDLSNPLGVRGLELMRWFFETATFQKMHASAEGQASGSTGIDNGFAERSFENVGAWILGRNMFGPVRGPWESWGAEAWNGWWGEEPPYHVPVFVLTHHARPPLEMKGGTTFHFVTDGPDAALALAKDAAGEKDVRIGGGVSTVRAYLQAGAIDELHLVLAPMLLGEGEPLFHGLDLPKLGFAHAEAVQGENATHMILRRGV